MGTSINGSSIGTIGSILEQQGNNVLDKLSTELKAKETANNVTSSAVNSVTPAQIKAVKDAQSSYGQAAVALNSKEAARTASKNAEKSHFNKVFKEIEERSDNAKSALRERLEAYKAAKAQKGFFKRIKGNTKKFFTEGSGKKVAEWGKKAWKPIKNHPKIAAGIAAALAVIGVTAYAVSGDEKQDDIQYQRELA